MFNLIRHVRLIGSIALVVGVLLNNLWLGVIGFCVFTCSYQMSIGMLERYIEKLEKSKEEKVSNE